MPLGKQMFSFFIEAEAVFQTARTISLSLKQYLRIISFPLFQQHFFFAPQFLILPILIDYSSLSFWPNISVTLKFFSHNTYHLQFVNIILL